MKRQKPHSGTCARPKRCGPGSSLGRRAGTRAVPHQCPSLTAAGLRAVSCGFSLWARARLRLRCQPHTIEQRDADAPHATARDRQVAVPLARAVRQLDARRHRVLPSEHDQDARRFQQPPRLLALLPRRQRLGRRRLGLGGRVGATRRPLLRLRRRRRRVRRRLLDGDGQHRVARAAIRVRHALPQARARSHEHRLRDTVLDVGERGERDGIKHLGHARAKQHALGQRPVVHRRKALRERLGRLGQQVHLEARRLLWRSLVGRRLGQRRPRSKRGRSGGGGCRRAASSTQGEHRSHSFRGTRRGGQSPRGH
eukprot:1738807-Prymnesium_polylepis.1